MAGYNEFIKLFGNISVLNVAEFILACIFLWFVYSKIRDYLVKKYEADKERDKKIDDALASVAKYPEYRQQSINIQQMLEKKIQELADMQKDMSERLIKIEKQNAKRERNKTRDLLLQNYRYYTNAERNSSKTWTRMEAEAFWELFGDYEEAGGDGYMHTVVQPEMQRLTVIDIDQ